MLFAKIASYFYYKYNFDCYKILTVIVYLMIRSTSVLINVIFSLYALNTKAQSPQLPSATTHKSEPLLLPPKLLPYGNTYQPLFGLIKQIAMISNRTIKCEFENQPMEADKLLNLPFGLLYAILLCSAISSSLIVCNTVVHTLMVNRSLHNKLVALKSSTKHAQRTLSRTVVNLARYRSIFELALLLVDDTAMPMIFAYFFSLCHGPRGVPCVKCIITGVNCFTSGFYYKFITIVSVFLITRVVMSILVITKVYILEFFIWTQTGTIFDFLVLRIISTIIYWGFFVLFVLTPTMTILQSSYYGKYRITGMVPSTIKILLPIGQLTWIVIILYKVFYLGLTKIVG